MGAIDVKLISEHVLSLEWDSNAANDMIADSTLALITDIDKSPASVKRQHLVLPMLSAICPPDTCCLPGPIHFISSDGPITFAFAFAPAYASALGQRLRREPDDADPAAGHVPRGALWRGRVPHA